MKQQKQKVEGKISKKMKQKEKVKHDIKEMIRKNWKYGCNVEMDPGMYCLYRADDKDRIREHRKSHRKAVINKLTCLSRRCECNEKEVAIIMNEINGITVL